MPNSGSWRQIIDALDVLHEDGVRVFLCFIDTERNRERSKTLRQLYAVPEEMFIPVLPAGEFGTGAPEGFAPEAAYFVIPLQEEFEVVWTHLQRLGVRGSQVIPHAAGYVPRESGGETLLQESARFAIDGRTVDPHTMLQMLADATCSLTELEVPHFAVFGSLLGLVRDGAVIEGDTDGDIALRVPLGVSRARIQRSLESKGFILCRANDDLLSFLRGTSYLDLYFFRETFLPGVVRCMEYTLRTSDFEDVAGLPLAGLRVSIPAPRRAEHLFCLWYGKDWAVPQSRHAMPNNVLVYGMLELRRATSLLHAALRRILSLPLGIRHILRLRKSVS